MTRRKQSARVARLGVSHTRLAFESELGWLFREQQSEDYGIDAHVEIVEGETVSGRLLALQIKSGESLFREPSSDGWWFRPDAEHVRYWTDYSLPVVVVLFNSITCRCHWQVVNSGTLVSTSTGGWKLLVPKAHIVNENARVPLRKTAEEFSVSVRIYEPMDQSAIGDSKLGAVDVGKSFTGTFILGAGFIVSSDEARELVVRDARNRDVLFPYLDALDLVSTPTQSANRWVINFHDWPEGVAATYPDCFEIVKNRVQPERRRSVSSNHPWWQYKRTGLRLRKDVSGRARVLAIARVSKVPLPVWVPARQVFSQTLGVFEFDRDAYLSLLSSNFHLAWAWISSSTMNGALRYVPSDVFGTLPRPVLTERMDRVGEKLDWFRRGFMAGRKLGLAKLYNLFHDPTNTDQEIRWLREIHTEVDLATAEAYGWKDIEFCHGFHDTRHGVRFTVAADAQTEILDRLSERRAIELAQM